MERGGVKRRKTINYMVPSKVNRVSVCLFLTGNFFSSKQQQQNKSTDKRKIEENR